MILQPFGPQHHASNAQATSCLQQYFGSGDTVAAAGSARTHAPPLIVIRASSLVLVRFTFSLRVEMIATCVVAPVAGGISGHDQDLTNRR